MHGSVASGQKDLSESASLPLSSQQYESDLCGVVFASDGNAMLYNKNKKAVASPVLLLHLDKKKQSGVGHSG